MCVRINGIKKFSSHRIQTLRSSFFVCDTILVNTTRLQLKDSLELVTMSPRHLVCVRYFHQFFIFSPNDSAWKTEKCFLFHQKSFFLSRDVQIFIFLSFPPFLPVDHCFRGWSKVNLKVNYVINCLNLNSITHFVWYLGKERRYDIGTLSMQKNHAENVQQKLAQDFFIVLVNNP